MTTRLANIGFAALLFATAAAMIWIAAGFDSAASVGSTMLDSNVFPIALMAIVAVGSVLLIVRSAAAPGDTVLYRNGGAALRVVGLAVLLVAALYTWEPLGFFVMSALFGLAGAMLFAVRVWWMYVVALLFGPLTGLVFVAALGVQL